MAVTGCNCGDDDNPPTQTLGNGTIGSVKPAAHDASAFTAPLDATPSSDGNTVFFTARNADGAGIFKSASAGGATTVLHAGDPISAPVGISVSTDDQMVFVADPGASVNEQDEGALWMVPAAGGAPTLVSGTAGYAPRGIVVVNEGGSDQLYFTGKTPGENLPGVFKVSASGGTVEALASGGLFSDPNGIAVTREGVIYVADSAAKDLEAGSARVIQVANKQATLLQDGLRVGFPAGIALSQDDSVVLVSALDPATRTDQVVRIELASKQVTTVNMGISTFEEAAGLHRAANAEVYAWADSSADGSGTVFVLAP
jgi:sugar lactone lactonase YvrE